MKQSRFLLTQTRPLTADTYELTLSGDTSAITAPGQFVNLELPGKFLRRPISVCDWTDDTLRLLVKVVGDGTHTLTHAVPGTDWDVLSGLGNGFDASLGGAHPVLVGGGIGTAPLYGLARRMVQEGAVPTVILGFRTAADVLYEQEFAALGCPVQVTTEDGTAGLRGFVTDALNRLAGQPYVFACGPLPMLKAVHALPILSGGQFSFEARMGCGFGACMGCTIPTKDGYKRVCKDGPIFFREEIVW